MEIAVEGAQLDGMICLSSCDKTPPAHLMAAGRFNIPTILVICGYQPSGELEGEHVDIEDVFLGVGAGRRSASSTSEHAARHGDNAIRGPGVCAGMATANSMHIVCRGARDGAARRRAGAAPTARRCSTSRARSGQRIVEMVLEDLKPRDILTPAHSATRSPLCSRSAARSTASSTCRPRPSKRASTSTCSDSSTSSASEVPVLSAVRPNGDGLDRAFEAPAAPAR